MSYQSPYNSFVFENYDFDRSSNTASFTYSFDGSRYFTEKIVYEVVESDYDETMLQRALHLCFIVVGTSYYKCFPTSSIIFKNTDHALDNWQVEFATQVYTQGLSQFMFENNLTLENMPNFQTIDREYEPIANKDLGVLVLQSGGKDSLLLAALLKENQIEYEPLYVSSGSQHPALLDGLGSPLNVLQRQIDVEALKNASAEGGLNGHVPVTYIVLSLASVAAVLSKKKTILASIGAEGIEPHAMIDQLPVNHQWSKTWEAEQLFTLYVSKYLSPEFQVGSPLRQFSELRIAELFVQYAWQEFGHSFSSCNRANYKQGSNNQKLKWCGECSKCANSFLLFAPFVKPQELQSLFNNQNLLQKPLLLQDFKGLLGVDGVMKPFECVGGVDELRLAYQMAQQKWGSDQYELPFVVPESEFDYKQTYAQQDWVTSYLPDAI